jgi:hypothetical protein
VSDRIESGWSRLTEAHVSFIHRGRRLCRRRYRPGVDVRTRRPAFFAALAGGAIVIVIIAGLLVEAFKTPSSTASAPTVQPALAPASSNPTPSFPAPPAGAVVLAREAGPNVLAVAVKGDAVQVSVLGQNGKGVPGADVRVNGKRAAACGRGCYRGRGVPGAFVVALRVGRSTTTWHVDLPRNAPAAEQLVAQATTTYKALRSLAWHEKFGSNVNLFVTSDWQVTAPDRLAYQVDKGAQAVIIGARRWDKYTPGSSWQESPQADPVAQPQPFWASAVDAHVLGQTTFAGKRVTEVSFFDPKTPGWYQIYVEPTSLRTVHMDMFATAHFMHDTYFGFDATPQVAAPQDN